MTKIFFIVFYKINFILTIIFYSWFITPFNTFADFNQTKTYLYKAQNLDKTIYILGTIHLGVDLHELTCYDFIKQKIQQSDIMLIEQENRSIYNKNQMLTDAIYSDSGQEAHNLSDDSLRLLQQKTSLPVSSLSYFGMFVYLKTACNREAGVNFDARMDLQLEDLAFAYTTPTMSLDTFNVPAAIKANITLQDVEKLANNYSQCVQDAAKFIEHYKNVSIEDYYATRTDEYEDIKRIFMIEKRHQQYWMPQFRKVVERPDHAIVRYDNIFIVAGALHFIGQGPFNFINLLEEKGFVVTPVTQCQ